MISRLSAKSIADAYYSHFTYRNKEGVIIYNREALYDFLFVNNFDALFLNRIKNFSIIEDRRLKEFIMQLHTGESVIAISNGLNLQESQFIGQEVLIELAECLIRERLSNPDFEKYDDKDKKAVDFMQKCLELDGYIYSNGVLLVSEEGLIEETEESGVLEKLMISVGLKDITILKHHLDLSVTHYQESNWDDSISNSRKVLEGVLAQVADRFNEYFFGGPLDERELAKPAYIREYLENQGLIEKIEKDTITQIYGLLSHTGAHPYMAERDQARLMRHLALTFSQFILLRLEGVLKNNKQVNQ